MRPHVEIAASASHAHPPNRLNLSIQQLGRVHRLANAIAPQAQKIPAPTQSGRQVISSGTSIFVMPNNLPITKGVSRNAITVTAHRLANGPAWILRRTEHRFFTASAKKSPEYNVAIIAATSDAHSHQAIGGKAASSSK